MMNSELPNIDLLNVSINQITESQCIEYIIEKLHRHIGGWVITPNLDHMYRLHHSLEFKELCCEANLIVADGMPLVWASKLQGTPLPERVAGSNLINSLTESAATNGFSIYLLGGEEDACEKSANVLNQRHSDLKIAGFYSPPFGFEKDQIQIEKIKTLLTDSHPDIVYVALGSPKQELLIKELKSLMPNTWFLGIGISLSFISGHVRRAPAWMQRIGLEWLHRLVQEPGRLAKRYLMHGVPFVFYLMYQSIKKRLKLCNK
ncbi:WecB/TagA/CpsF family glycosyltransferase [Planctomycetota bacterium]|nr:WecB/TagA/CpsF family glycosyltransferase [Planctomycetota bacterium]